jgi:hypothetical protein
VSAIDDRFTAPPNPTAAEVDCQDLGSERWWMDQKAPLTSGEKVWKLKVYAGASFGAGPIYLTAWNPTGPGDAQPGDDLRIRLYSVTQFGGQRTPVFDFDLTKNGVFSPIFGLSGDYYQTTLPFTAGGKGSVSDPYLFELVADCASLLECFVGEAKTEHVGEAVYIPEAVVTSAAADLPGLWVESSDRAAGVCVDASWSTQRGDTLAVAGVVSWVEGVPRLTSPELKSQTNGNEHQSLLFTSHALASDPTETLTYGAVNPVGQLVTAGGVVTCKDTDSHVFYIDDGSHLADGMGSAVDPYIGLRVAYKSGWTPPSVGGYVRVTGIRSVEKATLQHDALVNNGSRAIGETLYLPVLIPRDSSDIQQISR